jgi:hypothetical protein
MIDVKSKLSYASRGILIIINQAQLHMKCHFVFYRPKVIK